MHFVNPLLSKCSTVDSLWTRLSRVVIEPPPLPFSPTPHSYSLLYPNVGRSCEASLTNIVEG